MLKNSRAFSLVLLGLISCAPARPTGIPDEANARWSLKGDWTWTWERTLPSGCAAWMAKDRWAAVQLIVESRCEGDRNEGRLDGRGASYFSVEDHLVFIGYWPWTQEDHFNLIVFDNEGMISDVLPCPHVLPPEQIGDLQLVAQEALAEATTDAERRMLVRVAERLAATNGAELASGQSGCTDLPPDRHETPLERQDPWTAGDRDS
jgi:hypothetical protein